MFRNSLFLSLAVCLICTSCQEQKTVDENKSTMHFKSVEKQVAQNVAYPESKTGDAIDDYFGTEISDPYRWLEDDYSDETQAWVQAENKTTFSYLDKIPFRKDLRSRLDDLYDYEKLSAPFKRGDYYYFFRNDGLQAQSVLNRTQNLEAKGEVILDPNKLSTDGTVSLSTFSLDSKNELMAFSINKAGSDWQEIFVQRLSDGEILDDNIKWVKFSGISWRGNGFYYNAYPAPEKAEGTFTEANTGMRLFYHKIGDDQKDDQVVYEDKENPTKFFGGTMTEDERFLVISGSLGTSGNDLFIQDLENKKGKIHQTINDFDSDWRLVGSEGDLIYFMTNREAPNWKLVEININNPTKWEDVIPADNKNVMNNVSLVQGKFFVTFMEDVKHTVKSFDKKGKLLKQILIPGAGNVSGFNARSHHEDIYYTYSSFTAPTSIYKYNVASDKTTLFKRPTISGFNPDDYVTEQIFYPSKDGTKIPMYVIHKKGIKKDGKNPTWLYGYGGFDISLMPSFSTVRLAWLEQGGIYVQVNLRGGGEYGSKWHEGGIKLNKQNVFDDFIGAAEYLIEKKYTSKDFLAIHGRSNGGLLVGACMTQRPDLFKVALPGVGVLDMLRYEKFTIGYAWASDYGSVSDEKQFDNILKYSPLHNLKQGVSYPSTMIHTADHDDRVVPAHSFKFAAALQKANKGNNPMLIRIEEKAGHGAGKPTDKILDEYADLMGFMMYEMGVTPVYDK